MGYAKQYLNYESIDIYGAQEAVTSIRSDRRVFSTTQCLWNKETANGFLVVSAEIESRQTYNQHAINIVLRSILNFFEHTKQPDPIVAMRDAILQANRQLFFEASHNISLQGITLSVLTLLIREKQVFYAYVGNNNLFYASGQKVKRLTPGVAQVEGDEHEEIPLLNSSIINPELRINVSTEPLSPDTGDYLLVCPRGYVYTSDDFVVELLRQNGDLDLMAGKMLRTALGLAPDQAKTFVLVRMNMLGGKGSSADDFSLIYGGLMSRIIAYITSPVALVAMAILAVVLLLTLFGKM